MTINPSPTADAASEADLDALAEYVAELELRKARENPSVFGALVMRDEKGAPPDVSPLHLAMSNHVTWAWANRLTPVVIVPWGHGKTVWLVIGRTLWELGHNPTLRIKVVCNTDPAAMDRVRMIARYIESDDYKAVFPHIYRSERRPGTISDPWNQHDIRIEQPHGAMAVDPTVAARGVLGTGIGGRCDLLIGDDICDYKNSIVEAAKRPQVKETWERVWESRLESAGRKLYVATPWHQHDTTAHISVREGTAVFRAAVNEGVTALETSVTAVGASLADYPRPNGARTGADEKLYFDLPLWETRWPREELLKEKRTKPRAFAQGRELKVYADGELSFPSLPKCYRQLRAADLAATRTFTVGGVDLASRGRRGTALFVAARAPSGRRVMLDVRLRKLTSPQTAGEMAAMDEKWHPDIWVVENNAYQTALVDWIRTSSGLYRFADRVVEHRTGANKTDPDLGLPMMEAEFASDLWDIPALEWAGHAAGCECAWCLWRVQMEEHPMAEFFDLGMAHWFTAGKLRMGGVSLTELEAINNPGGSREAGAPDRTGRGVGVGLREPPMPGAGGHTPVAHPEDGDVGLGGGWQF